ncbi:MAG: ferrous iron transport protein B [Oscillospiraceae bacterium]|jgi:ferrous iron transport protein B|nr:ferrous iron transport protein B [Oscillospiraceae bacterium]
MPDTKTLESLSPGESAVITAVGNRRGAVKRRLIDMGLTPGTEIFIKKIAPFGDPVEVRLRGYELSLRKEDLSQIFVGEAPPAREKRPAGVSYPARKLDAQTLERMRLDHEHEMDAHTPEYDHRAHDRRRMTVALAGNPNSGKTTLFNALTGSNQYVGNWPGVTVEKKEGNVKSGAHEITIVDLPGVYSLSPYSMEEIVSRDYIIGSASSAPPDAIINIIDATNIERNLYLTVQLLELERPMVVALNFMDELRGSGTEIDVRALSRELGIPVVPITAKTGENLQELLHMTHRQIHLGYTIEPDDLYDDFTHMIHHRIDEVIHDRAHRARLPAHWASIKLLEGDAVVENALRLSPELRRELAAITDEYESAGGGLGDRETLVADSRYGYIERVVSASVRREEERGGETRSDRIDRVATHKFLAVPAFLLMMFLMFNITFGPIGSFLSDGVGSLMDALASFASERLSALSVAPWLVSLVSDGIITGVGGVLTFLPQIALLFLCLSILEDSGYMARAAFIMDRLLRRFGLSGKAFIPMLMGFGCSVPAVMGARTMENEKDRRMTILLVPFMSCSAKLPVYGLIAAAFFGKWAGVAIFSLYVLGMLMGILSGIIFKKLLFAGEPAAFVMELPPYRMPSLRNTALHVWERVRGFIVRAGTLILVMSVVIWFLQSFDSRFLITDDISKSILARFGTTIAPIFRPLGFGNWQAAVSILTGLIAKEAVVASMSMFYGFSLTAGAAEVAAAMSGFTPASAFAFLVFILLYVPCVAAVAAIYREMNSLKWTALSVAWQIGVAYICSMVIFLLARLVL